MVQIYKKKFLPLAIEFYNSITDEEMSKISDILKTLTNSDICKA